MLMRCRNWRHIHDVLSVIVLKILPFFCVHRNCSSKIWKMDVTYTELSAVCC